MNYRSYLIVNADDFGLTEGTNNAIARAHREGIVTSTSLLANGLAFDHAVALARATPSLDIGLHLTLTEGLPIAPPDQVRALLTAQGELPLSNQPFARALIAGRLPIAQIRREFEAQAAKVIDSGIRPSHVDGHKYIHLLPGITAIAADIARRFAIPMMRVPRHLADLPSASQRVGRLPGFAAMTLLGRVAAPTARRANLHSTDHTLGFIDTGHLDQAALVRLLSHPQPGITELLCHPADRSPALDELLARGYQWIAGYDFEAETAAVASAEARELVMRMGWQRGSFADAPFRAESWGVQKGLD